MLNLGFFAAVTYFATDFLTLGLHTHSRWVFATIAILWGYCMAWIAIDGIHYVAKLAHFLNWIPLAMILIVFWNTRTGIAKYQPAAHYPAMVFAVVLAIVIGYFATAGAAGADFALSCRDRRDVIRGGLVGITLCAVVVGGLALASVAGAIGKAGLLAGANPFDYTAAITRVGALSQWFFFLFAAALLVPTCFSCFIAANSFAAMVPRVPRRRSALIGASCALVLTVTGVAGNLIGFFSLVGACFGPVCGAMAAEYWLSDGRWDGPRQGVNLPGYIAWALGCAVGLLGMIPGVPPEWRNADQPAALYSTLVALFVYVGLAKAGSRAAPDAAFGSRPETAGLPWRQSRHHRHRPAGGRYRGARALQCAAFALPTCNNGRQMTLKAPFSNNAVNPALSSQAALNILQYVPVPTNACGRGQRRRTGMGSGSDPASGSPLFAASLPVPLGFL